jgi:hypothetical protein
MREYKLIKQDVQSVHSFNPNVMMAKEKKDYQKPEAIILRLEEESAFLAASPNVRPGGGGSGSQVPGAINVVPPKSDDNNPDDDLEG